MSAAHDPFKRKVVHRVRGECWVTSDCMALQRTNPDPTTMFVELDGETIEVTKGLVDEIDFMRASGDCVCDWCNKKYSDHPRYKRMPSYDGSFPLRQLCDGRIVKL